jgi:NCAIR mutase (PurE)-related protein
MPDRDDPLATLRTVMESLQRETAAGADHGLRLDPGREARTGVPEVVYAPGKTADQVVRAAHGLLRASGRAIVSRVGPEMLSDLRTALPDTTISCAPGGRTAVVREPTHTTARSGGQIAILTAGTSDFGAADEARIIAEEMGCAVQLVEDVGVAGIHRLFPPLAELFRWGADAIIVAAGMDGALPSVVAGLAPMPVIGLPTPVGYGIGANGVAALQTMLQSCAPGLTVVNIDNGIGAGVCAARIANQSARAANRIREA